MTYQDKIDFVIVYIREAHADRLEKDQDVAVKNQPKSLAERMVLATQCVAKYKFTIPMVLDNLEGSVAKAYQAMPVRVTITDTAGKVVYYGGKGPRNFKIPEIEAALKKLAASEDEKTGR